MGETIMDGTGSKYEAKVDDENNLHTTASCESMIGHRSHYDASAFGTTTPILTITSTGGKVLYLRNNDTTLQFTLTDIWFSWNGGNTSTTQCKCMIGALYFADGLPTANNTAGAMGVLNRTVNYTADITVNYWDEVGDGMTCTGGAAAFNWINTKGHSHVDVKEGIILGVNDSITVYLKGEEAGEASVNIYGYMMKKH